MAPSARPLVRRLLVALLLTIAVVITVVVGRAGRGRPTPPTHTVRRESLHPTITTRGDLESADATEIVCRARSNSRSSNAVTTIRWLLPDGTMVRKGDKLVELDPSGFEEDLEVRRVPLELAALAWRQAEEQGKIVASQVEGEIQAARDALELAEIDLPKYLQGEYVQERTELLGQLTRAESDLALASEHAGWAERMESKGYFSAAFLGSEWARVRSARLKRNSVRDELRLLEGYTRKRLATELRGKLDEARGQLRRVEAQATAKRAQAEADRLSKLRSYQRRLQRWHEIEGEIRKCTLRSPQDGLVIYAISEQARSGVGQPVFVAEGEPVQEGQVLMLVTNLSRMQVGARIHEAHIAQVRGDVHGPSGFGEAVQAALLTQPDALARAAGLVAFDEVREAFAARDERLVRRGQEAEVRLPALPGRVLRGRVRHVGSVPSQSRVRSDVCFYSVKVLIEEPVEGLRPDMTADVTVRLDPGPEALTVPRRALLHEPEQGDHATCYVWTGTGATERDLVIGRFNAAMAEVIAGLSEGEQVLVNPEAWQRTTEMGR